MNPQLKIKRLDEYAVIPEYATNGSAGLDLTSVWTRAVKTETYYYQEYGVGLAVEIPKGWVGLLFARSSISKTRTTLANAVGVIDSDYRGEITLRFRYDGLGCDYAVGERIGQLVLVQAPQFVLTEVEELTTTARGTGGYGSTNSGVNV